MADRRPLEGRTVALVLDNPQRDLAGLVLVATVLAEQGVTCHLVPASLRMRELFSLRPDLVLLFHLRRGFERLVARLIESRIRIGVLDNEGGVWPDPDIYCELQLADDALRRQVDFFCAWGPKLTGHLVEAGIYEPGQMVVTGCPRFDFLHDRWRPATGAGASRGRRPRILLNTSFSDANPRSWSLDAGIKQLRDDWGWSQERIDLVIGAQTAGMMETIELARDVARDFPDAETVVRPHPFESPDPYVSELAGVEGLEVDARGTSLQQLARATAAVQRSSTTAIEAVLAGVPALQPAWITVALPMPMVDAVSDPCATYPELRDRLRAVLDGTYSPDPALEARVAGVVGDWFHRIDGDAHRRVAEAILAHLPERREVDDEACERILHGLGDPQPWRSRVPRLVRSRLGLPPEFSFRRLGAPSPGDWLAPDQRFSVDDVAAVPTRLHGARREAGLPASRLSVGRAHERPGFPHRFPACSVTLFSG